MDYPIAVQKKILKYVYCYYFPSVTRLFDQFISNSEALMTIFAATNASFSDTQYSAHFFQPPSAVLAVCHRISNDNQRCM